MDTYDCSFKVADYKFVIEEKILLDSLGNLKEYWKYYSEGPLTYTLRSLQADTTFFMSLAWHQLRTNIVDRKSIIINSDTLSIERIFEREKLILLQQNARLKENRRRLLIAYN